MNDQQVTFNVLNAMKSPDEVENCNLISVVDSAITKRFNSCCSRDEIKTATFEELEKEDVAAGHITRLGETQLVRHDKYFKL